MPHKYKNKLEIEYENLLNGSLFSDLALQGNLSSNLVGFCRYLRTKGLFIGMAEEIDRYYSKKYWIPKAGFEKPEMGKSYSASLRRRRLAKSFFG